MKRKNETNYIDNLLEREQPETLLLKLVPSSEIDRVPQLLEELLRRKTSPRKIPAMMNGIYPQLLQKVIRQLNEQVNFLRALEKRKEKDLGVYRRLQSQQNNHSPIINLVTSVTNNNNNCIGNSITDSIENDLCVNAPRNEIIPSEEGKPSKNPALYHRRSGEKSILANPTLYQDEPVFRPQKYLPEKKPINMRLKSILEIERKETDPSVFTEDLIKIVYKNAEGFDPSHLMRCSSLKILNLNGALSYFRSNAEQRSALRSLNLSIQNSGCVLKELNLSQNAIGPAILEIKPILNNITILNISDIGIDGDTGKELFQHLNPQIGVLNLSLNNIGDSILSLNVDFNYLEVLDISSNRITSDGLDKFLLKISFCTKLQEINLSDNGFLGDKKQDGWLNFCTALSYMEELSSLRVGNIGLSHMQIERLLELLSKKTLPLMFLDIRTRPYCSLDKRLAPLLISALKNIPTLSWLCIDRIQYLPEVEEYLKTRVDMKVEWNVVVNQK